MKIYIVSSMNFAEEMLAAKKKLENMGHEVLASEFVDEYIGKTEREKEKMKDFHKKQRDAIKRFWDRFQSCDAMLVLNYEKKGIDNYIGGNTLLEIGFAYVLNKKIFMLNPIPDIGYYKSEIEAMRPLVINGDFSKIR